MGGLETGQAPGATAKLSQDQQDELGAWIEAGPQASGYKSGVWTGPMIGDLIERRAECQPVQDMDDLAVQDQFGAGGPLRRQPDQQARGSEGAGKSRRQ